MRTVNNYFNFTKGIISEASPINFPENACIDMLNVDLFRTGRSARRKSIAAELGYVLQPETAIPGSAVSNEGICANQWISVNQDGASNFAVVQVASTVYFHNMSAPGALSANIEPFTFNLTPYASGPGIDAGKYQISTASGLGNLFIGSPNINPVYLTFNPGSPATLTPTQLNSQIRDLQGLDDGLAVNENPDTLSAEHHYNLLNQGWTEDTITAYFTEFNNYPSNAQVWWVSKDAMGAFDPAGMTNFQFGTTAAARGHFILDLFNQDRSTASGVPGLPIVTITQRPSTLAFFYGRLFFAIGETLYGSQVVENLDQASAFYQAADPASEIDSLLVEGDGVVIPITGAGQITTLVATETSLVIGATNGVWALTGNSGTAFNATNYRVMFVADMGVGSQNNIYQVEDALYCVSAGGVYVLQTSDRGNVNITNITQTTIQTLFLNIPAQARQNSTAFYDSAAKKFYILYDSQAVEHAGLFRNQYDSLLVYDLTLQAWVKHSLSSPQDNRGVICDALLLKAPVVQDVTLEVVVGNNVVIDNDDNIVTVDDLVPFAQPTQIIFLLLTGNATDGYHYTFGNFSGENFYDFTYVDDVGGDYQSYMLVGYQLLNDIVHRKGVPYIYTNFNRTEQNWVDGDGDEPVPDFPSSCLLSSIWEWASDYGIFRKSFPQQAYRLDPRFTPLPNLGEPYRYPFDVVQNKTSLRGQGKCASLLFMSESGKDWQCNGWALVWEVKPTPS